MELLALDWKPARLSDIDSLPRQTLIDLFAMRAGMNAAQEPWAWYRTGDPQRAILAHYFRVAANGPEVIARCGVERDDDAEYRRESSAPLCQRCEAIAAGKPLRVGTIGDLDQEGG